MRLQDICEINPKMQKIDDNMEVSFVPMTSVSEDGKIDTSDIRPYIDVKKGYTSFKESNVLFAKITPCMENGKGAIARGLKNGYGCGSSEFHVLRTKGQVMPEWIYYLTSWSHFRREAEKHMTGSAGQRRVPKLYLENYEIRLPKLSEQKYQVLTLTHIKEIIDCRKAELEAFEELKKARFVEMFGDPVVHLHKGETVKLDTIADKITVGFVGEASNEYVDEGVPYLRTQNVRVNRIDLKGLIYVNESFHNKNQKSIIHPGDVVISRVGANRGMAAMVPDSLPEANIANCLIVGQTDNINSYYLFI